MNGVFTKILRNGIKIIFVIFFIILLIKIYRNFNPTENHYFPKCPFKEITNLKCPGCGSQRAVHYLLNFDLYNAIKENMLLVLSIPYLLLGISFDFIKVTNKKALKWRKTLFGQKAIFIILTLIILFWILRNL